MSPFADKLHTNYVPLGFEIDQIYQLIAKPLDDISQLNEKIARLQAVIDGLSRERDELSRFVEDHRALLSSARRLPQELMQEIFLSCLPNDRNAVMSSSEAPVLLGSICKSWRQISLSTPQLWSSLHIPIPDPAYLMEHGRGKVFQRVAAVRAWLELSGSCPLSLSVISEYREDPREEEELLFTARYFLHTIIDFSARWRDVDFAIPLSVYEEYLSTLEKADVPMLEKICFHRLDGTSPYPLSVETWHPGLMFRTPSLHHITLLSLDHSSADLFLRWGHLTHLSLIPGGLSSSGLSSKKALGILSQCSKLISCKMVIEPEDHRALSTVTLPFLRSLEIMEGLHVEYMKHFFETLSLPSLQHFKYLGQSLVQRGTIVPFRSIMTQAQTPGIESFELALMTVSRVGLISECLPLLPSLKRLTLSEVPYHWTMSHLYPILDDDFLTLLTPLAGSGEGLFPHLEEIKFDGCTEISDDAICPFLTARTSSTSLYPQFTRLKHAKFSFLRQRNVDVFPQLTPLIAEGLHVHLNYPPDDPPDDRCSPWRGLRVWTT